MQAPSSNGSSELTIIFLFVLFLLLVSSAATGIYFYTREETNCNKIEKSYDCKFNDKCKWNEDDSECEYDTDTDSDSDTDSDTDSDADSDADSDTGVPYQIPLSSDDFCNDWGKIHQGVPGCGRICSSEDKRGMKTEDSSNFKIWSSESNISSECMTASKIDKIWEVQSGSSSNRKLVDGYTLSNYPVGTSVKCDKNDLNGEADGASTSVYRVSETGTLRHYINSDIAASWDPEWGSSKTIGDCKGLTLGDEIVESNSSWSGSIFHDGNGWKFKVTGYNSTKEQIFYLYDDLPTATNSLTVVESLGFYPSYSPYSQDMLFLRDESKTYYIVYYTGTGDGNTVIHVLAKNP